VGQTRQFYLIGQMLGAPSTIPHRLLAVRSALSFESSELSLFFLSPCTSLWRVLFVASLVGQSASSPVLSPVSFSLLLRLLNTGLAVSQSLTKEECQEWFPQSRWQKEGGVIKVRGLVEEQRDLPFLSNLESVLVPPCTRRLRVALGSSLLPPLLPLGQCTASLPLFSLLLPPHSLGSVSIAREEEFERRLLIVELRKSFLEFFLRGNCYKVSFRVLIPEFPE